MLGGGGRLCNRIVSMMSRAVSEPEKKKGGLSHQTICKLFGTKMSMSSSDYVSLRDGST